MARNKSKKVPLPSYAKSILFNLVDLPFTIRQKTAIRNWIIQVVLKEHKTPGFISYNLCSDKYLLSVNKKHLSHNFLTDIITFELSDGDQISGDIYISIERVKENAKTHNTLFHVELKRVLVHGVLHLCGYKDKSPEEAQLMRKKENYYLSLFDRFQ